MSPFHPTLMRDRALGVETVFAGQVDTDTARSIDVVLWDDDATVIHLTVTGDDDEGDAAA
jgi:hypothetical protein